MPLNIRFSHDDERLRGEIRDFLKAELSDELIDAGRRASGMFVDRPIARIWQQKLNRRGWGAVHWPTQYGGTGWSPTQRYIFREGMRARRRTGVLDRVSSMLGAGVCSRYGTPEAEARIICRDPVGRALLVSGLFGTGLRVPISRA